MSGDTKLLKNADVFALRILGLPRLDFLSDKTFPSKGYALLAILLLAPGRELSRHAAATMLWEDIGQQNALGNLRQLLARMLKAQPSGQQLLIASPTSIRAGASALQSDLCLFLDACQSEDPQLRRNGLLAMRGELLQGLDVGQDQLYLWLLSERLRLRDHFFELAQTVLRDITRYGSSKPNEVALIANHIINFEPDREESYKLVIDAYARTGNTGAASRVYESLRTVLGADQKTAPSVATTALYRRVQTEAASRPASVEPQLSPASGRKPRVAFCLPNRSDGEMAGPLTRALVEDVANSLVRFRTFSVIAPHSSFSPRAEQVTVDFRVHSTVLSADRISFSLVDDQTFEIIWSSEFAFDDSQLHAIFRHLSKQVAAELAGQIERYLSDPVRPCGAGAYLHLLRGQQLLKTFDLGVLRRARNEFRKAAEQEPALAAARGRIAQTLQLEWLMLGGQDPYLLQRGKAEAEAAIEADAASGIGHWMAAVIALYQRDYDTSAQKFFEAEALAPGSADLLLQHADALAHFGEPKAAWHKFEEAIELNPLAPDIYWWAGASIAFDLQDYKQAIALCGKMENDEPALRVLTASHALDGDAVSAKACAERLMENYPGMTAREIARLSPDKDSAANENFYQGLKLAGIK
jgi:DNA-binding SARP family transcriptional activator/Tfp pilus assembly protein PilF